MRKTKNTVPPCAPETKPDGIAGTGQKPASVAIYYDVKSLQVVALRAQALLAVEGIVCYVPPLSKQNQRESKHDVIITICPGCVVAESINNKSLATHQRVRRAAYELVIALRRVHELSNETVAH